MKKKLLNTLLAGAAITCMGAVSANAATLDAVAGDVYFLFNGFDAAQADYDTSGISDGDTLCATVTDCDAASIAAGGVAAAPGSNSGDDTWGFSTVSSITGTGFLPPTLWAAGDDGEFLFTYFHGFQDAQVDRVSGTSTNIFSAGGQVDIFRVDAAFLGSVDLTDQSTLEGDLAALTSYLELDFIPGCSFSVASATLCGNFDLDNLEGDSNGFAVATGGTAIDKYPFSFQFEQSIEPCSGDCVGTPYNITVRSGSALTTALPEPGTLGLLGLGLVGMGLLGRRRKA